MFNVALAINYWDDPEGLLEILTNDTVYDFVHIIYVIDGRYKGRHDNPEHPIDYIDDLKSIYSKMKVVKMDNFSQIDKRNMYWDLAERDNIDFVIVCDSDEYIEIQPEIFNSSLRILKDRPEKCFPVVQYMENVMTQSRPRLFRGPFTFRHRYNEGNGISHGSLYEGYGQDDKEVIAQMYYWFKDHPKRTVNGEQSGIPGIKMWHDKKHRSRERVIADRVYYDEDPKR